MQIQRDAEPATGSASASGSGSGSGSPPAAAARRDRKFVESGGGTSPEVRASDGSAAPEGRPVRRSEPKVGRNDPCPCGSGKKYKKCHGAQPTV